MMESLQIESTDSSPFVKLDIDALKFNISGECRPEDTKVFFTPILEWLEQFKDIVIKKEPKYSNSTCHFYFRFEYFNSTSAKYIVDIMKILRSFQLLPSTVLNDFKIIWEYDELDDEMRENGQELIDWTEVEMELVKS